MVSCLCESAVATARLVFQPMLRSQSGLWLRLQRGVTFVWHAKPQSGGGAVIHVTLERVNLCHLSLVLTRLKGRTSELLRLDAPLSAGRKWRIVFDYFCLSLFPWGDFAASSPVEFVAISKRNLWLDPDVWRAVLSQGFKAIYAEDIKWPNGHIIRTQLTLRESQCVCKVLKCPAAASCSVIQVDF